MSAQPRFDYEAMGDLELAGLVAARDPGAARVITGRNNQRLFRAAWSVSKDRAEAEDVVQAAYLKAFAAIGRFQGASSLSTWLTRIVLNEALERRRSARRREARLDARSVVTLEEYRDKLMVGSMNAAPDGNLFRAQIRGVLERAIARLPEDFRLVFVLREIEGLTVEETSEVLGVPPGTIKTRLLRARRRLQNDLDPELRTALQGTFPFAGVDCEALTERVLRQFTDPDFKFNGDTDHA
ncbi:MAG TPA: RNA polymerase sigma factor [Phenylobacterium sp.]|nr:RNA polymerase sigma factor [Phenylobacterium sp.]